MAAGAAGAEIPCANCPPGAGLAAGKTTAGCSACAAVGAGPAEGAEFGRITPFTIRPCTGGLAAVDWRKGAVAFPLDIADGFPRHVRSRRPPQRQRRMRRRMPKQQQTLETAQRTPQSGGMRWWWWW